MRSAQARRSRPKCPLSHGQKLCSATFAASFEARVGRDLDTAALETYFTTNGYMRASTVNERGWTAPLYWAALGLAAHCAFLPRIPTGSANPTRRRDISPAGVRLASMSAAASAYETIISGTR